MTNKQLERRLAQVMGTLRPETDFDTVAEAVAASSASADPASVIASRPRLIRRYVAAVAAAAVMVVCGLLMKKPKFAWLGDYALPISLLLGMASAIPISAWLG